MLLLIVVTGRIRIINLNQRPMFLKCILQLLHPVMLQCHSVVDPIWYRNSRDNGSISLNNITFSLDNSNSQCCHLVFTLTHTKVCSHNINVNIIEVKLLFYSKHHGRTYKPTLGYNIVIMF